MTRSRELDTSDDVLEDVSEEPRIDSASEDTTYTVSFNQNRSFELSIGRKMFCFAPYSSDTLTESEIQHPDFVQQSQYFSIKKN